MHNHEPPDYICPFCRVVRDFARSSVQEDRADVIFQDDRVTAFLGLGRWPRNPVDVLVAPNDHHEHLYDLPLDYALPLHRLTRAVSLALKAVYACDGVSTRQHNEPEGGQDVWHYHVHVTPRFKDDGFYQSPQERTPEPERLEAARQLREFFAAHPHHLFGQ